MSDTKSVSQNLEADYRPLSIDKVHPNVQLPFSIFVHMPENNKIILFRKTGEVLQQLRIDQIKKFADQFYVLKGDLTKAEDFFKNPPQKVSKKLNDLFHSASSSSDPNAKNELQLKSLELMSKELRFTIDPNSSESPVQQANKHIQKVVDDIIAVLDVDAGLIQKVQALQAGFENDEWNHALSVAAIAALFAVSLGYTDKKLLRDIATGGYLHDLGLGLCDVEPPKRNLQYDPEQLERYKLHPRAGLEMVETLELPVSEEVKLMIFQHEEKFEGGGFPMNLSGIDIFEPAQIVGLADRFDTLIRIDEEGAIAPDKALYQILEENSAPNQPATYSPILVAQIAEVAFAAGVIE